MPFEFTCPFCHNRTKVLDQYLGQTGPCVNCGRPVTMPTRNEHGVLIASMHQKAPKKAPSTPPTPGSRLIPAIVGVSVVAFLSLITIVSVYFLLPSIRLSVERTAQSRDLDNLTQIARALNAYADRYGTYPPPYVVDASGQKLYSWRVLILPFLGYEELYKSYQLNQAWDSPANSNLIRSMPSEYASPNSPDARDNNETNYVLIVGAGTLFPSSGPLSPKAVTDTPTLLVVETRNGGCIWSEPGDIDVKGGLRIGNKPMKELGGLHRTKFTASTVDEKTLRIPLSTPQNIMDAMVTPNGGEKIQSGAFDE